ncbi:MAG: hypothetical protein RIQ62_1974 [Bacteroidota bacterium]|jgi:hypothetical protein
MKNALFFFLLSYLSISLHAQSTNPAPYCIADFDDDPILIPNYINVVSVSTLNNASNAQEPFPHYVLYNNLPPTDLVTGLTYNLMLDLHIVTPSICGVWIDFNQNQIFENGEMISTHFAPFANNNDTFYTSFVVPLSSILGPTRMRVRVVSDSTFMASTSGILPCNLSTSPTDVMNFGETEDYDLLVVNKPTAIDDVVIKKPFSLIPNPANTHCSIHLPNKDSYQIQIFDYIGNIISNERVSNCLSYNIDASRIPIGVYIIYIQNENTQVHIRFQKE